MNLRTKLYTFSKNLSDTSGVDADTFSDIGVLFNDGQIYLQAGCIGWGTGTSEGVAKVIMTHIFARTIRFNKLFEYITVPEIKKGMESLNMVGSRYTTRTIRKAIPILIDAGLIVRIVTNSGRSMLYGLNIPKIIEIVNEFKTTRTAAAGTTFADHLGRLDRVSGLCNRLQLWYNRLKEFGEMAFTVFDDVLKVMGGFMAGLKQAVVEAKEKATAATGRRRAAKSAELFNRKNGEVKHANGKGGLAFWHEQVHKRKDDYPGYKAKSTGKMSGMMRNLLMELHREENLDTAGCKDFIEDLIEGWSRIKRTTFVTYNTNVGRTVPPVPDFEFYYIHRKEIDAKIGIESKLDKEMKERIANAPKAGIKRITDF